MAGERQRGIIGQVIATLGAVALTFVVASAGWTVSKDKAPCTAQLKTRPAPADAVVWTPEQTLEVNRRFCIGVKTGKYFAAELSQRAGLAADSEVAVAALATAKSDAATLEKSPRTGTPAEQTAATTTAKAKVTAAEQKLGEVQAKLDAAPKEMTLLMFVDDKPTPIAFNVRIEEGSGDGWTWMEPLLRVPEDAKAEEARLWRELLSGSGFSGERKITLGVGDDGAKLPRKDAYVKVRPREEIILRSFVPGRVALGGLGLLALVGGIVVWGWGSGMLRERPPTTNEKKPPFSLARTQMAFWFTLALGGYLAIWVITGQSVGVMTTGVVALLGISGATGAASIAVDKLPKSVSRRAPAAHRSGFLTDILSAGDGIVFHRVQMLAWTLVLGAIFIWNVFWDFTFPKFDEALLVLSGVVNGVYLGFKFPENSPRASDTTHGGHGNDSVAG